MASSKTDQDFMLLAIEQAKEAYKAGNFPVGAVLVRNGEVIGTGRNSIKENKDLSCHGEMECLRDANRQEPLDDIYQATYTDTCLYTTLDPCLMCTGAITKIRIPRVVIGWVGNPDTSNREIFEKKKVEYVILNDRNCYDLLLEYYGGDAEKLESVMRRVA